MEQGAADTAPPPRRRTMAGASTPPMTWRGPAPGRDAQPQAGAAGTPRRDPPTAGATLRRRGPRGVAARSCRSAWRSPCESLVAPDHPRPGRPLGRITAQCAFLRHCEADAATLGEPEWHAMMSVLGRRQRRGSHRAPRQPAVPPLRPGRDGAQDRLCAARRRGRRAARRSAPSGAASRGAPAARTGGWIASPSSSGYPPRYRFVRGPGWTEGSPAMANQATTNPSVADERAPRCSSRPRSIPHPVVGKIIKRKTLFEAAVKAAGDDDLRLEPCSTNCATESRVSAPDRPTLKQKVKQRHPGRGPGRGRIGPATRARPTYAPPPPLRDRDQT